ncbi:MAG: sensor histidine kinase [Kyrpidia sp.]|nr:sensor histidine kinase [Kyrpidia sp.]
MKKRTFSAPFLATVCLAVFLSFGWNPVARADEPLAVRGTVDFSSWDWIRQGTAVLDGEWEFYWNRLLTPRDFLSGAPPGPVTYIQVPQTWRGRSAGGSPLSGQGYGTYRLVIRTSPADAGREMALYIRGVATAYKLWINGNMAAEKGVVATNRPDMVPEEYSQPVFFHLQGEQSELILQVSNFVQRKGGLWEPISLGTAEEIVLQRERAVAFETGLVGVFFAVGLYHFGLFLARRKETWAFYFSGLCFAIGIRTLTTGETLITRLFPWISWEMSTHLEYLSVCVAVLMLILFTHARYPGEVNLRWRNGFAAVLTAYGLFVAVTPAIVYTYTMLPFQLCVLASIIDVVRVLILAWRRKRSGASLDLFAGAVMFMFAMNDVLYYNHLITYGRLIQFGMLFYVLIEAFSLAHQFSSLFSQTENLAVQLQQTNESLEERVRERTRALQESNARLQRTNRDLYRMEQARRHLLSNISHELGTPLTLIRGYIKAVLDRVDESRNDQFLRLTYDKTVMMERIIRDLLELSKLEAGQIDFHYQWVHPLEFFRGLFEKYEFALQEAGVRFDWTVKGWDMPGFEAIRVDPIRMEQVFANLLFNARKYTAPGGRIEVVVTGIQGRTSEESAVRVEIRDTGKGVGKEDLPFVFERFYRGREARNSSPGSVGLGLAICKEIVENHGGQIGVESRDGVGSAFFFTLPASRRAEGSVPGDHPDGKEFWA